jgi:hypothetical protein
MHPFTLAMFNSYQKIKVVHQNQNDAFDEYMYEMSRLSDESTLGDFKEVEYLMPYTNIDKMKAEAYEKCVKTFYSD